MILELPENKVDIENVLNSCITSSLVTRNIKKVDWLLDSYYLRGVRSFSNINYPLGSVDINYQDSAGKVHFKHEKLMRKFINERGRRLRVDLAPKIEPVNNLTLDGLRKASTGQAALDTMLSDFNLELFKSELIECQLLYGMFGIGCFKQHEGNSLVCDSPLLEIVPPWEILPIPTIPTTPNSYQGLVRFRYVPLSWIEAQSEFKKFNFKDINTYSIPFGENPDLFISQQNFTGSEYAGYLGRNGVSRQLNDKGASKNIQDVMVTYTSVSEVWLRTPQNRLYRYIVLIGNKLAKDTNYLEKDKKKVDIKELPIMPLNIIRDISDGSFYGKSFTSILRPLSIENEVMVKNLIENVSDMDDMGYLCLPSTLGINAQQLKKSSKPKYLTYEPDLSAPEHKPFALQPVSMGEFPAKIAQFIEGELADIAGQTEVTRGEAPGRVDSGKGIGMLYEASSIGMNEALSSLANCLIESYKCMLMFARREWDNKKLAALTLKDDNLLGLTIDDKTYQMKIEKDLIPEPSTVVVRVRAEVPETTQQQKDELIGMLKLGIIQPRDFRRINYEKNLGLPVGSRAEFENWRKAKIHNVLLFNDGKTPRPIVINPESDIPDIHLEVLSDFMSRPEFMLADKAVRSAFVKTKQDYMALKGGAYPEQLGYPEDEAMGQQDMMGQMEQQGMQGPQDMIQQGAPTGSEDMVSPEMLALAQQM